MQRGPAFAGPAPELAARQAAGQEQDGIRKEPAFTTADAAVKAAPSSPADPAYEQFVNQPPWMQQSGPLHRNPISRAALMFGIFAIGAATGLASIWWTSRPADMPPAAASIRKFEPVARAQSANSGNRAVAGAAAGINPGELPYDGVPPDPAEKKASSAIAAVPKAQPDPKTVEPDRAAKAAPNAAAVVPAPAPPSEKAQQAIVEPSAHSRVNTPNAAQEKSHDRKVAKASARHRAASRAAKDKEIERIQQQAADELKKKTRNRVVAQEPHAKAKAEDADQSASRQAKGVAASSSAGYSKRAMLARCENASNFILRERCKWQICSGMWGKNGCPSYGKQASVDY